MSVYKKQPLTINLDAKVALTSVDAFYIIYKKPCATDYTVKAATKSGTVITSVFSGAEIDVDGDWEFRNYIKFTGTADYVPGDPFMVNVKAFKAPTIPTPP